jgi:hypothetical protein
MKMASPLSTFEVLHLTNSDGSPKYSSDRVYLTNELKDVLKIRGFWVPQDWASSDLIGAFAEAFQKMEAQIANLKEDNKDLRDELNDTRDDLENLRSLREMGAENSLD